MHLAFICICTMSTNKNIAILEMFNTVDFDEVILAFCLSMLVGLLIGILIFIFMTWISRRRASIRISTKSVQSSSFDGSHQQDLKPRDGFNLNSDTGRATLKVKRETSLDPNELLGHSFSYQSSTFRPVKKKGSDESEDEKKITLLDSTLTDPYSLGQSESFWLGKGSLRGFLPKQTPPPAYSSVTHIFQETFN